MKPYPKYKDPGVEWLREIPEVWEAKKIKYLINPHKNALKTGPFGSQLKGSELDSDGKYRVYNQRNVLDNDFDKEFDFINDDKFLSLKEFEIFPNDILVTTRGTIGHCSIFPDNKPKGVLHPCLIRIQLNPKLMINSWLTTYINNSISFKENVELNSNATTIDVIYGYTLREVIIPTPPLPEQKQIAKYLDLKTAKIDSLIEKKKRLIELLKEERTAVINQAVTKGLDPNVPMKDSGIEWLADIPAHWEVKKIKYIALLKSGQGITSDQIHEEGEYPVYGGNGLRGFTSSYTHNGQFVLIGRQGALCGNINYAKDSFWASEHAVVVAPKISFETFWLGELLRAMNLNQYSISAAQPGLSVDIINNLKIPFPSLAKQNEIVKYIDKETSRIDSVISKSEKEIDLLLEYRTALISEVVTGKIDVREEKV